VTVAEDAQDQGAIQLRESVKAAKAADDGKAHGSFGIQAQPQVATGRQIGDAFSVQVEAAVQGQDLRQGAA
jgi:hypothetical protein